jgi:hypothetical protein
MGGGMGLGIGEDGLERLEVGMDVAKDRKLHFRE